MRRLVRVGVTAAAVLVVGAGTAYAVNTALHAGPQGDGTGVTPAGWRVTPAGAQTALGSLPTASALSPDGKLLLVLNAGDATHESVQAIDPASHAVVQTIPYKKPDGLYAGVAFSPDGRHAYASSGGANTIHAYSVDGQHHLTEDPPIALPTKNPAGQVVNLYPAGLAVTPDGKRLVVADQMSDSASVVDLATRRVDTVGVGHNPYGVALSPDGRTAYVSNQGANTVSVLDISGPLPTVARTVTVGTHPNRMAVDPHAGTVYVANSESDSVSVVPAGAAAPRSTIDLSPYQGAPVGSNPDGLALSADAGTLYVANSGNNDVDVVDAHTGHIRGMIPTAWYPTAVTPSADGRTLFVVNAKGLGAGPNPNGPNPYTDNQRSGTPGFEAQYVGTMIAGSLSSIPTPDAAQLAKYSQQVVANDGFDERDKVRSAAPNNPVPARVGEPSPIKHVIYVVKENRTFDQEFGSLGKGNGDPSLNLFGDDSAPNSRALQRKFVTLDNFYANAEVSAQGWNWSVGANSNPYVEQTWVGNYSGRNHPYDYEGGNFTTAMNRDPKDSYIWDRLADKNIAFRNYGFYESDNVFNPGPSGPDPRLVANTDPNFYGWDLKCPDSSGTFTPRTACNTRIDEWQREFQQYEAKGNLPAVEFLRLGNDHTQNTTPGYPTPKAYVADNDYALGRLVDSVSHSRDWASTAIFVVEDDAQAGPDHVDAHRTIAQVISPYTQTGKVDSTQYSTASMLRTIELIAGIGPMTQFDATATPMFNSFTGKPNLTPYTAVKPAQDILTSVNGANAPMAAQSAAQDYTREDQIDEQVSNQAIWQSVRGAGSPMPAPVHAAGAPPNPPAGDPDDDGH
ncbi:bifunctional YncE family protein/alkaline phosphatase family protein [Gandjariella thermophila]|uniref:Phosphoesterase n=1 Tax=Gandjariella thermophila TaxID=1931992 RepID=A0A4D4JBF5_9PSEU|nr:bifunctional YncE family protein/alkaline phosphatase family protein [Gandjariella thermophila]GDY31766.1 phosphoesterase [Gandjariella thermophila]